MRTLLLLCLGLFITGCVQKDISVVNPTEQIQKVKNKDTVHLDNIKKITAQGYYLNDSLSVFKELTLPGYVGPSMALSQEEYILKKYSKSPLMFSKYGVKDRLFLLTGTKSLDKKNTIAQSYGFKDLNDMFEYLFFFWTKKETSMLETDLKSLAKKDLVDLDSFKKANLDAATNELVFDIYSNYLKFENINDAVILDEWFFTIDGKQIIFKKEDYKPYAFILILIKELLDANNEKGVILNDL